MNTEEKTNQTELEDSMDKIRNWVAEKVIEIEKRIEVTKNSVGSRLEIFRAEFKEHNILDWSDPEKNIVYTMIRNMVESIRARVEEAIMKMSSDIELHRVEFGTSLRITHTTVEELKNDVSNLKKDIQNINDWKRAVFCDRAVLRAWQQLEEQIEVFSKALHNNVASEALGQTMKELKNILGM